MASETSLQAGWNLVDQQGRTLVGLKGYWTRPAYEQKLTFTSDTKFVGRQAEYLYDTTLQGGTQYGNVTHVIDKAWNGSSFTAYRASQRRFYPNVGSWLVGLPAFENHYVCPSGSCNYIEQELTGSVWNLYDGQSSYAVAPSVGKLTGNRTFICYANSSNQCVTYGSHTKLLYRDVNYGYDGYGNRTSQTIYTNYGDASTRATTLARTTTFAYNDGGHNTYKTSETNPANHTTSWLYNYRLSVPTQETDPNSIVTTADYDAFGRLAKIIRPGDSSGSPTVAVTYYNTGVNSSGPFGVKAVQKHSGGNYTLYKFYDGLGQLIQSVTYDARVNGSARDIIVDTQYNAYGQVVKQTMPYDVSKWGGSGSPYRANPSFSGANTTNTTYDNFGRVTKVTPPTTGEEVEYFYTNDLTTVTRNANNYDTTTIYDIWGRVAEVHPPNDPWLRYTYDAADHLTKVEKMTGSSNVFATTIINYDVAGRKLGMSDMDMGAWSYSYDALGNLISQTDARGCTTTLTYNDGLSRLTNKNYSGSCGSGGMAVWYFYDDTANGNKGKGKRTAMSDSAGGSSAWFYGDSRGRLTRETKIIAGGSTGSPGGTYYTQWGYDSGDQITSMIYPDGEGVTYSYLPQMVVNSVTSSLGATYVQSTQYDAAGRVELRTLGSNQLRTDYQYQPWNTQGGRLVWLKSGSNAANDNLQRFEYNYDANGNVNWIKDYNAGGTQTQSFGYDTLDRLTTASATGGTGGTYGPQSYSYDSYGRLLNGPLGNGYTYNSSHKHAVATAGGYSYGYDANGNMSSRTVAGATTYFSYDAENRLTVATGAVTANTLYDGDGTRTKQNGNGVATTYLGNYYEIVYQDNGVVAAAGLAATDPAAWPADLATRQEPELPTPRTPPLAPWPADGAPATLPTGAMYLFLPLVMDGTLPAATTETWPDHFSVNLNNGEVCNDERMPECADWWSAPTTPAFFLLPAPDRAIGATTKALTRTVVMTNITGLHLSPLLTSTAPLLDAAAIKAAATESIVNLPNPGFESSGSWNQGPLSLFPATAFYRNWFDAPAGRTHTGDSDGQHYGYSISNHGYGYLFSDAIAVSANTQYDLYVYLRGQLDSDDSFSGWYIESYFYNSSGSYIGVQVVDSGFALGTNWSQEGGRFTTPAGTASTRILLLNYFTTGWLAFDDVSLIRVGTSTNLAPNPSFETTSGWTEVGSSLFPGASFFRSTGAIAAPRSGSYAYALSNLAYGVLSSPQFAVSGGQTYWVSAYVRGEADGDAGYTTAWIGVRYFDSSGAYLGLGTIAFPTPTNSWQYVEGTVTPPANAATMYVDLEFYYASGWVAFDEVAVRRASNNTLVYSSGFETSGEWGEWKPTQFPGTSFFRGTGAIATPYSGSYALAISNHAYGALTSPALAITAGQAYEVTAYGRGMLDAEDSAGAVWLGIRYYNSSGGYLGYGTAQLIDPSAITTSWQRFGGVVIPPSGATSMILDLESYYNSGWVTFDDVAVGEVTKYYYAGSQRIAMRQGNALYWLLGDHLGSTAYTVNGTTETGETRYYPWGKDRFTSGQTLTSYKFTGQREEAGLGLYYYGARWYDPALGRFIQPDTIVPNPGDVQSFDRYAYVNNNPLKYIDPTGHWSEDQLNEVLGNNWQFRYFGDLAPYKGAFAGNDKLLQFLTSSETTNMFDLRMVGVAMGVGEFMSTLVGNTPDAIAIRGNFGAGAIIGVGNSFEAVVNFRSSELSYFWSPGASGGAIGGAGGDIGISIINDLPSNTAYRGYFGAVKADFKYGAGGTVEGFLGLPLPNFPDGDIFAGANGAFLGVGLGGELDLSAGFSYAFEALRVNTNGRDWGPNWRNYHPVADAGEIFYQAYWGLGLLIYGDSWISANND